MDELWICFYYFFLGLQSCGSVFWSVWYFSLISGYYIWKIVEPLDRSPWFSWGWSISSLSLIIVTAPGSFRVSSESLVFSESLLLSGPWIPAFISPARLRLVITIWPMCFELYIIKCPEGKMWPCQRAPFSKHLCSLGSWFPKCWLFRLSSSSWCVCVCYFDQLL